MAEDLKVDTEALREAARRLRELSGHVEDSGLAAQPRIIQAGSTVQGSRSGGGAGRLATSVGHATGDLATALSALSAGIGAAGSHFDRVEAEATAAARAAGGPGAGPGPGHGPGQGSGQGATRDPERGPSGGRVPR